MDELSELLKNAGIGSMDDPTKQYLMLMSILVTHYRGCGNQDTKQEIDRYIRLNLIQANAHLEDQIKFKRNQKT